MSMPMASMFLAVSMKVSPLLRLELDGVKSSTSALSRRAAEFAFHGTLHVASQRVPLGPFEL